MLARRCPRFALAAGLVTLAGCSSSPVEGVDVEAAVLAAAVDFLQATSAHYDTVLVHPSRTRYPFVSADDFLREQGVEISGDLSSSLRAANMPGEFGPVEGLSKSQVMEPGHASLVLATSRDAWALLADDVGGDPAVVWFSGVGVDEQTGSAIVYYDLRCAPLECIEGHFLALRRTSGRWHVVRSVFAWAS